MCDVLLSCIRIHTTHLNLTCFPQGVVLCVVWWGGGLDKPWRMGLGWGIPLPALVLLTLSTPPCVLPVSQYDAL